MKYRKKPVEVEAFQFDGDLMGSDGKYYVPGWAEKAYKDGVMYCAGCGDLCIKTLEGEHLVNVGDYIIKGVKGELYPCKPDIFEMTYEPVLKPFSGDKGGSNRIMEQEGMNEQQEERQGGRA